MPASGEIPFWQHGNSNQPGWDSPFIISNGLRRPFCARAPPLGLGLRCALLVCGPARLQRRLPAHFLIQLPRLVGPPSIPSLSRATPRSKTNLRTVRLIFFLSRSPLCLVCSSGSQSIIVCRFQLCTLACFFSTAFQSALIRLLVRARI